MELRIPGGPEDVRGHRRSGAMRPIHCPEELGQRHPDTLLFCILTCQFVCGSDDFQLRVYNISTGEKITSFEAHPDYIRCLTVHPTLSLVLTGSDDMTVKCWDWDKQWRCVQVSACALISRFHPDFLRSTRGIPTTSWLWR